MDAPPQTQPIDDRQTPHRFSPLQIATVLLTGGVFLLLALAVVGLFYSKINYLLGIALMLPAIGFALILQLILHRYGPPAVPPPLWPARGGTEPLERDPTSDLPFATESQPEI